MDKYAGSVNIWKLLLQGEEMPKPYIGIVGVKNTLEAEVAARIIERFLPADFSHRGQVGVQVTTRTLRGEVTESRRNPIVTEIPAIFSHMLCLKTGIFTVVHFTTREHDRIPEFIDHLMTLGDMYKRGWCKGLQLNGAFGKITPQVMEGVRKKYPKLEIIMQLHKAVLYSHGIGEVCSELSKFNGLVDFALIDPSGGRGEEMNVESGVSLGQEIRNRTDLEVGYAGGLREGNVGEIITRIQALTRTSNFSIDAEGGLRDKRGEGYGNDDFNPEKAFWYFEATVRALNV